MANIFVVEDDPNISRLIQLYLEQNGHSVSSVANGLEALQHLESQDVNYDLVILDLMLPGLDGRGVARRIRDQSDTPIIMLTALDDSRDILEGFGLGADDYITKPFNPGEMVARVRALLKRSQVAAASAAVAQPEPAQTDTPSLLCGNVTLDTASRLCRIDGHIITLRAREFDLLAAFLSHPGVVLTRQQLFDRVWRGEPSADSRTVDVHVSRLRERLSSAGADISIETVRSIGYRLDRNA